MYMRTYIYIDAGYTVKQSTMGYRKMENKAPCACKGWLGEE